MGKVSFQSHEINFSLPQPRKTANWIRIVMAKEKKEFSQLSYIFCSDAFLLEMNQKYLSHQTYTDILTFDYSEEGLLEGEIFISIPRVKENAVKFDVAFEIELRRVIIHGVLHLIGFKDKTTTQKAIMRKKEQACLSLY